MYLVLICEFIIRQISSGPKGSFVYPFSRLKCLLTVIMIYVAVPFVTLKDIRNVESPLDLVDSNDLNIVYVYLGPPKYINKTTIDC